MTFGETLPGNDVGTLKNLSSLKFIPKFLKNPKCEAACEGVHETSFDNIFVPPNFVARLLHLISMVKSPQVVFI